jgi:cell division transport system ATP-binding protein
MIVFVLLFTKIEKNVNFASYLQAMKQNLVEVKDLSLFQGESLVVSGIDLNFKAGELVYLVGRVGSGKSTLIHTLYGELPIRVGDILIEGKSIAQLSPKELPLHKRKMGILFQNFHLLRDRSVYDNLDFVLAAIGWTDKLERKERIEAVLEQFTLLHKAHLFPNQLSGGEQQRVALARAVINDAQIILADEPTVHLDSGSNKELMCLLSKLCALGKLVIVSTHNHQILSEFPGRVILFEDGKVIEY